MFKCLSSINFYRNIKQNTFPMNGVYVFLFKQLPVIWLHVSLLCSRQDDNEVFTGAPPHNQEQCAFGVLKLAHVDLYSCGLPVQMSDGFHRCQRQGHWDMLVMEAKFLMPLDIVNECEDGPEWAPLMVNKGLQWLVGDIVSNISEWASGIISRESGRGSIMDWNGYWTRPMQGARVSELLTMSC